MKLPFLSFLNKQTPKEYFLALLLQEERVQAVVFEEANGTIHSIGEGKATLPEQIDNLSFEELLTATDKAISQAERVLPENVQSHKTIFGVKENWTKDTQIDKDHLTVLKKLCAQLDLQPIGFLVFAEAIAHLLQKQEGAPISAILVELGEKTMTATLVRAGRVIASQDAPLEENIPQTLDTLLKHFTDVEILPSRIILVGAEGNALVKQITNHTWSTSLPFLHVPQVSALSPQIVTQAILFGTATQMGFDVQASPRTRLHTTDTVQEESPFLPREPKEKENEEVLPEEEVQPEDTEGESEDTAAHEVTADNFGFVTNTDVLENAPKHPRSFDDFATPTDETEEEFADETFADIPEEVKEQNEKSRLPGLGVNAVMMTEGMQTVVARLKQIPFSKVVAYIKELPTFFKSAETPATGKKLIFIAPVILLVLIGSILWYIFGLKATATLLINPKIVQASQGVTFAANGTTDTNADTIAATSVPITENGNATVQATGSKDVGDKAKGTVTIYNISSSSQTFPSGTEIIAPNGLKFTMDNSVNVASGSSDPTNPSAGTASISVTATDIGQQYNLPSGTKFSIANQDSSVLAAKNDTAFSGGTKKTITVVSQSDIDKVTTELTKNLGQKAQQDVQKNINGGMNILPIFLSTTMSGKQLDHKAGDQASSVTLTATISYDALSYNKADLDKVAQAIIQANNQGENISTHNVQETVQNPTVSKNGQDINATLQIKAGLLPQIDTNAVAKQLAGKPVSSAQSILTNVPQLAGVKATLSPNLFFLPQSFPHIASHILVGVASNE